MALYRVEVRTKSGHLDPRASAVGRSLAAAGLGAIPVRCAKVYLLEGDLSSSQVDRVAAQLLADPVVENADIGGAQLPHQTLIEVHPLPGVMDPAAASVREGLLTLLGSPVRVSTGVRYDFDTSSPEHASRLHEFVSKNLANPVIHQITVGRWEPASLPQGHEYKLQVREIPLRGLSDSQLATLSRDAHLFLSVDEMRAIKDYYESAGRDPSDIELETVAQTWSEHCVHKTLKSNIRYTPHTPPHTVHEANKPGEVKTADTKRPAAPHRDSITSSFTFAGVLTPRPHVAPTGPARAEAPPRDVIDWSGRKGHTLQADGSVLINNLLKSTVAAATFELIEEGIDWALSVFTDNSGVVALDDTWGVCIKVETHNHPSALEPYGGSATGIGGCIRDIIGTGLGAKPIASTDVFCVAFPENWKTDATPGKTANPAPNRTPDRTPTRTSTLPPNTLSPRRILSEVVAGVRDYGNRMGIPTVNGAVLFGDRYVGNPLVFCGCIGLIPRTHIQGKVNAGDRIIALGGRTGRDGIHGATFSSAELEHTHAAEFSHAVQIGNAIEEKRTLDVILQARDAGLFTAITDCGAGGFSSAVGEMGSALGAQVHLDKAPLKYAGLSYTEIWISEAQERLVLAVPPAMVAALGEVCAREGVEMADLGEFGTEGAELELYYHGTRVGRLPMSLLHDGIPQKLRDATWAPQPPSTPPARPHPSISDALLALLAHPNIASKHWIIRQYDHEVQGATVIKPLVGPGGRGPGDAAVIEPIAGSGRGVAIGCGIQVYSEPGRDHNDPNSENDLSAAHVRRPYPGDPYLTTLASIDECIRNLVCVGADPTRIAILDNFCWPSCEKPENLGSLVRAAEACYDGAKAYRTPFVSGKDSLNNQLRYTDPATGESRLIEIAPTLLITGLGIVPLISQCVTMDAKQAGNNLMLIGATTAKMGGSHYAQGFGCEDPAYPELNLKIGPATARAVAQCIREGLVRSAHDCSDGGLLVAVAEMLIATSGVRASTTADTSHTESGTRAPGNTPSALDDLLSNHNVSGDRPGGRGASQLRALGAQLTIDPNLLETYELAFAETPSRYILEVEPANVTKVRNVLRDHGAIPATVLGALTDDGQLLWDKADLRADVTDLAAAWLAPLDW